MKSLIITRGRFLKHRQIGVAAVEFALVSLLFFTLLFAVLEFGRLLFVFNTMQEVTRSAAHEATVSWIDQAAAIKQKALFGGGVIPGGAEVTAANIQIEYLDKSGNVITVFPTDPSDNLSACNDITRAQSCIYSVRVSIVDTDGSGKGVFYAPMVNLFSILHIRLPISAVTVHAESLGFTVS